jgi:transposase
VAIDRADKVVMDELKHLSKRQLIRMVLELQQRVAQLEAEIARLRKDSSTSSKPPSSDLVKPPRPALPAGKKRHLGGQPGHERHERPLFPPEQIDHIEEYRLPCCPRCKGPLVVVDQPARVLQQAELVDRPLTITEHRAPPCQCQDCGQIHYAPFPGEVEQGGLVGPRLTALCAYLKGAGHLSYATLQDFLHQVLHLELSSGQLVKLITKASQALVVPYEQLQARLPGEARLNVDETGHREQGKGWWTWCFRAACYTWFKIDPTRSSKVLIEVLGGEFEGVLGCDYFSAYRKYMNDFEILVQFCLAHLIRDVKFLTTLPDAVTRHYGERWLEGLRDLFGVIHQRDSMTPAAFAQALEQARQAVLTTGKRPPPRREAENLAQRFREHGEAYFRFITTPGVEPTNNLAEQALRFVVIDRKVTQGTRGVAGRRWCERIWTVIATCSQQGRSVFDYLHEAILAQFRGAPAPSLLLNSS